MNVEIVKRGRKHDREQWLAIYRRIGNFGDVKIDNLNVGEKVVWQNWNHVVAKNYIEYWWDCTVLEVRKRVKLSCIDNEGLEVIRWVEVSSIYREKAKTV